MAKNERRRNFRGVASRVGSVAGVPIEAWHRQSSIIYRSEW
jgi:hypothetical protein